MLTIGNTQYRNLQEQVLQNQKEIEALSTKANISNLGINIISAVPFESVDQLPLPYDGEYGDGFLVGTAQPYDLYIWTRESNEYNGEWFNWGPLNAPSIIPGPIGPQGIQGEQGIRGSFWYSQTGAPTQIVGVNNGDQALNGSNGDVFQFNNGIWQRTGNIRGPQGIQGIQGLIGPVGPMGPQGPQGETGAQGQFIEIIGTLPNINQLPDPTTVARSAAYLIPISGAEHVYLIVGKGTSEDPLIWHDAGGFGGGTAITINGVPQATIDLTNTATIPNYSSNENSSASIGADSVTFNNLEVTGKNPSGSDITPAQASIELPIKASENIEPKVVDNELAFDITQALMDKIEQDIADAKPPEVVINAPVTATNGQLTEEQLATLQGNKGAYLFFNSEIYRLEDTQHVAGYLIYTHVGYQNTANMYIIKCITITINTRGWVLTTRDVKDPNDYYTKTESDNKYYTRTQIDNSLARYLPLSGGTMTGPIKSENSENGLISNSDEFNFANNLKGNYININYRNSPQKINRYVFRDGQGNAGYANIEAGGVTIFGPATIHDKLETNGLLSQADNGLINNSNEFNFATNMSPGDSLWWNYRGTPQGIAVHHFADGTGQGNRAYIDASGYQVNGTNMFRLDGTILYITG